MITRVSVFISFCFFFMIPPTPRSTGTDTLFPDATLFRSSAGEDPCDDRAPRIAAERRRPGHDRRRAGGQPARRRDPRLRLRAGLSRLVDQIINQLQQRHLVQLRSEEHTSELQSLMRISYAVFCLKKKKKTNKQKNMHTTTQNHIKDIRHR